MANNCSNTINISGLTKENKEKIVQWLKTYDKFRYLNDWVNSIISEENQLTPNFDKGGDPYQYGGRWFDFDPDEAENNGDDENICIYGDSAWSPMEGMCEALSKEFQCEINIEFEEGGCDFGGETNYVNGDKEEIFNGTYREYQYYCSGLEYMESDSECVDDLETLKEIEKDWLTICDLKEQDEVKAHFKKLIDKLSQEEEA